jgi:16S rRNA (cytidine1402-2'-O)-methyltransferase
MSSEPVARGVLYLIPNTLGDVDAESCIPATVLARARTLDYFVAENEKSARAFLKRIGVRRPLREIGIARLDHNTPAADLPALLAPLLEGCDAGLLSEAGLPAVADPGASLVRLAHERGVRVAPLSGPSSLMLAVSASGLDGQRFAFHGYLPVEEAKLAATLKELERESHRLERTQIFIETPYRNDRTLTAVLRILDPRTLLCIATDLSLENEQVRTRSVADWKTDTPSLQDRPTVFLFLAN